MTDEQMAEWRRLAERSEALKETEPGIIRRYDEAVDALLAEVERLRAALGPNRQLADAQSDGLAMAGAAMTALEAMAAEAVVRARIEQARAEERERCARAVEDAPAGTTGVAHAAALRALK